MSHRRVVATGLGSITAVGRDVASSWRELLAGRCGIGDITLFESSRYRVKKAAEIKDFNPRSHFPSRTLQRLSRCDQLGMVAMGEAAADSGVDFSVEDRERIGIFIGGGAGGIFSAEKYRREMLQKGWRRVRPSLLLPFATSAFTDAIGEKYGILGPRFTIATACSSSATAIGYALDAIRAGEIDMAIAGGSESLSEVTFGGFHSLRSVDEEHCRPFDRNRKGLSLGEGAAILVMEEAGRACARGARIYGEVKGYGLSGDGHHMTAPDPEGKGALRAMQAALRHAGVAPEEVDAVNAHGTGTPANDVSETRAIRALLGARASRVPVSAIKSMIGHCLGAAGAVEAVATLLTVFYDRIPPTIHYETPDPECDLDVVPNEMRQARVEISLSNSFAFGGNNTALVFGKWKE